MIYKQQKRKPSYTAFIFIAIVVGFGRWFLETNLGIAKANGILPFAYAFDYIVVGLSFFLVLHWISGISARSSLNFARLGLLVGLLPPVIDLLNSVGNSGPLLTYSYYLYEDFSFFSPMFYAPTHGFPLGEAVAVWLIIIMTLILTIRETRNPIRIFAAVIAAYSAFLIFLILLPKGLADFFTQATIGLNLDSRMRLNARNISTQYHVFVHFGIIILQLFIIDKNFRDTIRHRLFHYLPFGAIAITPFIYTANYGLLTFCVPLLVMLNFIFACMQNDLYDKRSKNLTDANSEVTDIRFADSVRFLMILLLLLIVYLYGIGSLLFFPTLIFMVLTLLYNLPETRMRFYILGGQKIEGGWGVCALWSGLVNLSINPFHVSSLILTILLFFGWAYLSSIKDLKDILSDRHAGRKTLISFFQAKFGSLSRAVCHYRIQVGIILLIPALHVAARKGILHGAFFFAIGTLPLWVALIWASRMRVFKYFSAGISLYFISFAYLMGY